MKLSFRIYVARYKSEEEFRRLLSFLLRHKECVDELALFTEYWLHGYYPLEEFEALSKTLKDRIQRLRDHGFRSVGINMTDTMGHTDEAWDRLPKLPFHPMMGPDGRLSKSCPCPNTEEFRYYIQRKYEMVAKAKPDFVWVDDDVRMHCHGVEFACFCPRCLSIFNEKHGTNLTRETLVEELNSKEGREYREKWVNQNIENIENLLSLIEKSIHDVDGNVELGLMTNQMEWTTYSGVAFDRWMKALKASKARPGGGFYGDATPIGLVHKALECARQMAAYPEFIKDVQYELENSPYQRLEKSIHAVILESTVSIANGLNGIAFNTLKDLEGTLEDYHDLMEAIIKARPLWEAMGNFAVNFKNLGFYPALSPLFDARRNVENGNWFEYYRGDTGYSNICSYAPYVLSEIGIPLTMEEDKACGFVLTENMPEGYTKEELRWMLAKGVLLDGEALEVLWNMGLGEYCGVSIKGTCDNGVLEQFTNDIINRRYRGDRRDSRLSFWKDTGHVLEPLNSQVRVLSELIAYSEENLGPAFTLYENSLGGRVAVHGYAPWKHIHSAPKRAQMIWVCDWISKGTMPIKIEKCVKVAPFIKASKSGSHFMLMLLNASLDETGGFDVEIRMRSENLCELKKSGKEVAISTDARKSPRKTVIRIRNIMPWDFMIVKTVD